MKRGKSLREKRVILCVAPHPDDETLGCGGTLIKHGQENCELHWLIVTEMLGQKDLDKDRAKVREDEISNVSNLFGFASVHRLGFPSTRLDSVPMVEIVDAITKVVQEVRPEIVYLPYRNDAHSDHSVVFDSTVAATKSFRHPYVKSLCVYETVSETEFGLRIDDPGFRPNLFVDISSFLDAKLEAMKLYGDEIEAFPFPRSEEAIKSLSKIRGVQSGCESAEGFMIIKEIR